MNGEAIAIAIAARAKLDHMLREIAALKQHSIATNDAVLALRKDIANLDERVSRVETRLDLRDGIAVTP